MSDDLDRYYLILGLEPGASAEEVRLAYRDCVDAWHPDRFSHAPDRQQRAEARLKQINVAYRKLRRQARPSADRSADSRKTGGAPDYRSRTAEEAGHGSNGAGARQREENERRASSASKQRSRGADGEPAPPTAEPQGSWLELTRESPLMVSTLYFSALGVIVAAGCGVTLGAIHGGPIGAIGGLLASPLAGVSAGGICGAVSALVAAKLGGRRGRIIGGAVTTLAPGLAMGAFIVSSVFQAVVAAAPAPPLHLAFGGACGGALGATLGGWAGKAVAELMGEA